MPAPLWLKFAWRLCLVWPSSLGTVLQSKRLPVRFSLREHAWEWVLSLDGVLCILVHWRIYASFLKHLHCRYCKIHVWPLQYCDHLRSVSILYFLFSCLLVIWSSFLACLWIRMPGLIYEKQYSTLEDFIFLQRGWFSGRQMNVARSPHVSGSCHDLGLCEAHVLHFLLVLTPRE